MKSYEHIAQGFLPGHRKWGLFTTVALVCACILAAGSEGAQDRASTANDENSSKSRGAFTRTGPTVQLNYSNEKPAERNPLTTFLYFIPLISPTQMELESNADNKQKVSFVSCDQRSSANSFVATWDFYIEGTGFHTYLFDSARTIEVHKEGIAENETMKRMLDYIKIKGAGFGRIQVEGVIDDSAEIVNTVRLQFNIRGQKSPVTIGLYDVEPEDGEYTYENRSNELIARVNKLEFTRGGDPPRMDISVASIEEPESSGGFFSRVFAGIKGAIANLMINPPPITPLGQETMLEFGKAIRNEDTEFTFPHAENFMEPE